MILKVGLNWWRPYGGAPEVVVVRKRDGDLEGRRATSFVNSWISVAELTRDGDWLGEAYPPPEDKVEVRSEEETRRRGRPKIEPPDEAVALLGKKKDSMIAQMFGVSPALVSRWRTERGILATRKRSVSASAVAV